MTNTSSKTPAGQRGRIVRGLLGCCKFFLLLLALYLLIALVGLIPVNMNFEPSAEGVEIMVASTAIHADLVLPIRNETMDWTKYLPPSDFGGDVSGATHVALGWGNKAFYIETPTWSDVKVRTVLRALFWASESCMHVYMWDEKQIPPNVSRTTISHEQYRRLVDQVLGSFQRDASDRFLLIRGNAYGNSDAFYDAHGSYHSFNTCNCWVGRALQAGGVRTGWFTPLPKTATLFMSQR